MRAAESQNNQNIERRIADAEAEVARAQAHLDDLRYEAARSDEVHSPDDIVDAVAAESAAEAEGSADPSLATAVYDDMPFVPAKDHVAAGLLAILLGSFGIHKFYLGYTTAGFITLAITIVGGVFTFGITSIVMAIIGIVEGILYMAVSQSKFESTHVARVHEWF